MKMLKFVRLDKTDKSDFEVRLDNELGTRLRLRVGPHALHSWDELRQMICPGIPR
jgi:hypothetical protein